MKLRRRHVLVYVLVISLACLFVVFQSYDKYSRNRTITEKNKILIERYLNEEEKKLLIDNNINVNLFLPFIKEEGFVLKNYEYYHVVYQFHKKMSKADIVKKGNQLVELQFTLNSLNTIFKNKIYTVNQLIVLANYKSPFFPEAKPEFYPNNALALSNQNFFIYQYEPNDLEIINPKFTLKKSELKLRSEANKQLNLMCENLRLLTNQESGNLKVQYAFLSHQDIVKKQETSLGSFNKPGHSDFQLGNTISFYPSSNFDENRLYIWLLDNAPNYGFIQRFPADKVNITNVSKQYGIFRYVGVENAKALARDNKTIEEKRGE